MSHPEPRLSAALISAPAGRVLNHLLEGQPWLRQRLAPYAGRTFNLEMAPVSFAFLVEPTGALSAQPKAQSADVSVVLTLPALARFVAGDEAVRHELRFDGDAAFAAALAGVVRELRWDFEEDLSRVVGDIAAHRLVEIARSTVAWPGLAARNLAQSAAEYWTEERPLLASRTAVNQLLAEIDDLRDALERLEKRVERLTANPERRR